MLLSRNGETKSRSNPMISSRTKTIRKKTMSPLRNDGLVKLYNQLIIDLLIFCTYLYRCVNIGNYKLYQASSKRKMNIKQLESDREESQEHYTKRQSRVKKQIKNDAVSPEPAINKLVYPPGASLLKTQKQELPPAKAQLKAQIKAIKYEIKNQKAKKRGLFYSGPNQKKKEIQKLAFPPPQKLVPLKNMRIVGADDKKLKEIEEQTEKEAKFLILKMKAVYKKDLDCFLKGQLAYHKVRYLKTLSEKLNNVYVKNQFIEQKGLKQFEKWLQRIINEEKVEFQPSLALKLGLIKILRDMNLTAEQLQNTRYLKSHINRNRQSQIQELRELATDLISNWEYVTINSNTQQNEK